MAASRTNSMFQKLNGVYKQACPYEYLAKDGVIEYNGIVFACDTENNAISLGDVSDKSKVITVRLSGGGTLYVNRENIGEFIAGYGNVLTGGVNCILRALADDAKIQKTEEEIEEAVRTSEKKIRNSLPYRESRFMKKRFIAAVLAAGSTFTGCGATSRQ